MIKKIRTYITTSKLKAGKKTAENNGNISATAKQIGIAMGMFSNLNNKANQSRLVGT